MNVFSMLLVLCLCVFSCGPAQDKAADTDEEGVRRAENLFILAYEELDAAIMGRMLAEDFEADYTGDSASKDRRTWLAEIQSYRAVFPDMRVTVDSLDVVHEGTHFRVSGIRTFTWSNDGQGGSYRERYRNFWRRQGGEWKLYRSKINSAPPR